MVRAIRKFINELTALKILVDKSGMLISITMKSRAFYFFFSSKLIGLRTAPTTDPHPGIVEASGYDIEEIVKNWKRFSNLKLRGSKNDYSDVDYSEVVSGKG